MQRSLFSLAPLLLASAAPLFCQFDTGTVLETMHGPSAPDQEFELTIGARQRVDFKLELDSVQPTAPFILRREA
jgi:hypothetical protein